MINKLKLPSIIFIFVFLLFGFYNINSSDHYKKLKTFTELLRLINDTYVDSVNINNIPISNTIEVSIPKTTHFIHKCYIESAREFYKDPFLFEKNIKPKEKQANLRQSIYLIKNSISESIRKLLPIKEILNQYLVKDIKSTDVDDEVNVDDDEVNDGDEVNVDDEVNVGDEVNDDDEVNVDDEVNDEFNDDDEVNTDEVNDGDEVMMTTLDSIKGFPPLSLIKISANGMELPILMGAMQTLSYFRCQVIVDVSDASSKPFILDYLKGLNYNVYEFNCPLFTSVNHRDNPKNVFKDMIKSTYFATFNQPNRNLNQV